MYVALLMIAISMKIKDTKQEGYDVFADEGASRARR